LACDSCATVVLADGSVTYPGSGATATPTPTPTSTQDTRPVSLSDVDRAKLDALHEDGQLGAWAVGFATFVLGALTAGVLVTTGLRR